ncbi:MAG: RnfABCDGE type electron transport complex subunit D [Clostridia bacterium]|nr:RnfABCDGE type electron transport complex subunit D [Clostridia bacterium]
MSLRISTAPHMHNPLTTQRLMQYVFIALLPTAAWGVYAFGFSALLVLCLSMASSVCAEFLWQKIAKQPVRVGDFSALVTGLILGLNLPATAPWWMVMIGAFFAIMIVKQLFGGLGDNFLNPALAARAVLLASWPVHMTASACVTPTFFQAGVDAVSAATPLGAPANYSLMQLFLGQCPGAIGEVSKAAILIGLVFLLVTKVISWRIPVIMTASVFCCTMLISGAAPEAALAAVLSGGVLFGAVFMATDYVTSPITPWGQVIYAVGIGLIITLIRQFGSYPEGVTYGILLMNIATPLIDRLPRKIYGVKKEAKKA